MCITCDKKLGFGAMRLPLIDPDDPKRIDLDQICRMVDMYREGVVSVLLIPLTPIMKATPRKPCGNASWSVIPASTFCWRTRCLCFS